MNGKIFFNRDISWLSFNERVLSEAADDRVPLIEKIKFLSIYSSNLDEFYRVRMPVLQKMQADHRNPEAYLEAVKIVNAQQNQYGRILREQVLPELLENGFHFYYNEQIPEPIIPLIENYFFTHIAGFLQPVVLDANCRFFPENNQLYLIAIVQKQEGEQVFLVNIPSNELKRFVTFPGKKVTHILFLEDIIRHCLPFLFPDALEIKSYNIKITRDAELYLLDADDDDVLAKNIEEQLKSRDYGFASRFLYEPGFPTRHLLFVTSILNLHKASQVEGGRYHNLKDLASFPANIPALSYPSWPAVGCPDFFPGRQTLFDAVEASDIMVHTPYQNYDTILRFFNEAAIDNSVTEIYTTLYRVASDSRIGHALISAAKNGKKVTALIELKARFDEANNINWAKKMKAAGVKIIYSATTLKVHAKLALVKRTNHKTRYIGLFATGNLNETTARFYTDHILLTAEQGMLKESKILFSFLAQKKKNQNTKELNFNQLLVAQFNLHARFSELIDNEIENAKNGRPAGIFIKLNNLEEETLINKLYEASNAGVTIRLIVRSICRLIPGVAGQSENISIKRIVDRYLEHGRVFIFENGGQPEVYMGSADWMNRNIYHRIEVCFPIYQDNLKNQIRQILELQWADNVKAVYINEQLENEHIENENDRIRSQEAIYEFLKELAITCHHELSTITL